MAALALLVVTIYLVKTKVNPVYSAVPSAFMILMTGWAMIVNLGNFLTSENWLLFAIGLAVFCLEIWMIIESSLILKKFVKK